MNFPGPFAISPIKNTADPEFGLRVFQRVTAQVLSVTGATAVLEVDGHPVVAQLTSADQAASLASQPTAQFIITELTSQSITLKLIKNEQPQAVLIGVVANGPELAERILENNNLPVTITNLMMTRSMLKQHLPVTPAMLKESAYGVGGTTWEVVWNVVLPYTKVGVIGGIMLGLGRALGETMAVTFVVGNANRINASLFGSGNTIASQVALEFGEAEIGSMKLAALLALGFLLFVISFVVLAISRLLLRPREGTR